MRRWLTRLHRWLGLLLAAYVLMISLTGAALVYRPEIYAYFEPRPLPVAIGERLLSDEELLARARRAFPQDTPLKVWRGKRANHAVEIELERGGGTRGHLFDPYTGAALRPALPFGFRATTWLVSLHAELLGGAEGRLVNGVVGLAFAFLTLTGLFVWRPRRPPAPTAGKSLRRLHMTVGIWIFGFALIWGLTGFYLAHSDYYNALADYFEPLDPESTAERISDKISYWLAYAHFGRFGGRIPGCGREVCDHVLKVVWIAAGLTPAFLAASGALVWWRARRVRRRAQRPGVSPA